MKRILLCIVAALAFPFAFQYEKQARELLATLREYANAAQAIQEGGTWRKTSIVNNYTSYNLHRNNSSTMIPYQKPPNQGIAACLLVLDDTGYMQEWLAYHYTILPLSSLIVAIDPKSSMESEQKLRQMARDYEKLGVNITFWTNDTYFPSNDLREAVQLAEKTGDRRPLKAMGVPYIPHDERQCQFVTECMREHKAQGQKWVLLTDTDEYLAYNYIHNDTEDPSHYDVFLRNPEISDKLRQENLPLRQRLPPKLSLPIYDYLEGRGSDNPQCYRIPGIKYGPSVLANSSHLPFTNKTRQAIPRPERLVTLEHLGHEPRKGDFSKALIDVSNLTDFHRQYCKYIHSPETRACGGFMGNPSRISGADYIASLFRIHHHKGFLHTFMERAKTFNGIDRTEEFYWESIKTVNRSTVDMDIVPWVERFVEKVGWKMARELLKQDGAQDLQQSKS